MTLRWTAPEIFSGESSHTFEGDVYALGMTVLEIITGSVPWVGLTEQAVMGKLAKKLHPVRPDVCMLIGEELSDSFWELMVRCWASEPQRRPLATRVWEELGAISKPCQSGPSKNDDKGSLLKRLALRIPNKPPDPFKPYTYNVGPAVPTLAVSTLTALSETPKLVPLIYTTDTSLKAMLSHLRSRNQPTSGQDPGPQQPIEQSSSDPSVSHNALDHRIAHFKPSNLSSNILPSSAIPTPSGIKQPSGTSHNATNKSKEVPVATQNAEPPRMDLGQIALTPPQTECNPQDLPLQETNTTTHSIPIPPHMRSLMRLSVNTDIASSSLILGQRLLPDAPNGSSSSIVSIASSYVAAPAVASLPSPIRDFGMLRCESPSPLPNRHGRARDHSFQASSLQESIVGNDHNHSAGPPPDEYRPGRAQSLSLHTCSPRESVVAHSFYDEPWDRLSNREPGSKPFDTSSFVEGPSRKILIIHSSYKGRKDAQEKSSLVSLDGLIGEFERLEATFGERGYSIETVPEGKGFDRKRILNWVAHFVDHATAGDVRAIVFAGNVHIDNETVSLIPPECSKASEAITCTEWEQNIRDNARPGVVILSIMVHNRSGEVMKQEFDRQIWEQPELMKPIKKDEPIYLTFAASDRAVYESWVTRDPEPVRSGDHFIHALVSAIRAVDAVTGTWTEFFEVFDQYFRRARSCASLQEREATGTPNWRSSHQQTPRFSASEFVALSDIFSPRDPPGPRIRFSKSPISLDVHGRALARSFRTPSPSNLPSRKLLIIGSSYKEHYEVKRKFSIESLDWDLRDRDELKTVFKQRNYSVQTLIEEEFNSEHVLTRVAQFLNDAESGDFRVIMFIGHGHADEDGMVSLVPLECPSAGKAITYVEWDHNIRKHSRPGVMVFSIVAHSFSGGIMKQPFDTVNVIKSEPILLTFTASDSAAYESCVPHDSSLLPVRIRDHFIQALVGAIRSINISTGTRSEFFESFDRHFQDAQSHDLQQDEREPLIPVWRFNSLETTRLSAPGLVVSDVVHD
ncbi:hypothetical protein FRC11_004513 [Ceratobasidium sp. 423]|nr:hypothetical protein FRC11_004513 [Ceratobasidium sp. 423]